ncbi:class I SAM-dependent methyltransferase [Enterococcus termitis]|uniref:class I SAM-dependent methyltransferase n=1 Tax=Enterococcus termitis TaxID=332950 RepID=UPI0009F29D5A|nr:class I SAM-dependent methyltransferase [Enterococcus termitis]
MYIFWGILLTILIVLFGSLLKQSKQPTGLLGLWMMRLWNRVYLPMVRWALSFITISNSMNILDSGVGNGESTIYIQQLLQPSSITGIDSSRDAITEAKKNHWDSLFLSK